MREPSGSGKAKTHIEDHADARPSAEPPGRTRGDLPYDRDEWSRRLAEARVRRQAVMRNRPAAPHPPAPDFPPFDWSGDGEPPAAPRAEPPADRPAPADRRPLDLGSAARRLPREDRSAAAARRDAAGTFRSWRGAAVPLLAGCVIGAAVTAAVALVPLAWPRQAQQSAMPASAPMPQSVAPDAVEPPATIPPPAPDAAPPAQPAAPQPATQPDAAGPATQAAEVPPPPQRSSGAGAVERVAILAPQSVGAGARDEAAALLRQAGWPVGDPRTSPFTVRDTHVRYYHASDRGPAEELAALVSAEARGFTDLDPAPPPGLIELWMAGEAPSRGRGRGARAANPIDELLGSLERALRRLD